MDDKPSQPNLGDLESICCSGGQNEFYWRETLSASAEDHISEAVDAVMNALSTPTRRWNMWTTRARRGEIRDLIEAACEGEAVPTQHVKSLRGGIGNLFELRYQDIPVTDEVDGSIAYSNTNARINHLEPVRFINGFIGINAYEKPKDETGKSIQDGMIDWAAVYAEAHEDVEWGVIYRK